MTHVVPFEMVDNVLARAVRTTRRTATARKCDGGLFGTRNLKEAGGWIRDQIRTPDDF